MEKQIGCRGKINPSLKHRRDSERLRRGIRDEGISVASTDHIRMLLEEKERGKGKHGNIWASSNRLCGPEWAGVFPATVRNPPNSTRGKQAAAIEKGVVQ
ncbi:MAG: hypothetical protein ABIH46_09425 [Chloroflexota bacterium]